MEKNFFAYIGIAILFASLLELASAQSIPTAVVVTVVPNAPSNLTAVSTAPTQVDLTWTDNSSNENYFSIERKTGASGTYVEIGTTSANVAIFTDNSVSPETTYFYRVRAFGGGSYSSYSNETSVTTRSASIIGGSSGGSGGGGSSGGGSLAPPATNVMFSGSAYPLSQVFILKDGQIALQTIAGPDANFTASLSDLAGGNYTFSVYGVDSAGRHSSLFTFPIMITPGVTTMIGGIFLSPTIDVNKQEVKQGDTITIFGQSIPSAKISIEVDSAQPMFATASSNQSGVYLYEFDTAPLAFGAHVAKSKAASGTIFSSNSISKGFTVGAENVAAQPTVACSPVRGDFNGDCHVNIIDFSILAYWYEKSNPPPAYRLDGNSKIDLADFSIMAYYWTG